MGRFFEPYVGKYYFQRPTFGFRLLLVGESHYNDSEVPCGPSATNGVVESYLGGQTVPFFDYLSDVSCGHQRIVHSDAFWQGVAFANFVQRPMETPTHRPTQADIDAGIPVFWDTVEELAPDMIFMFTAAWNALPKVAPEGREQGTGGVGGRNSWLWRYVLADRAVLIARFNHPSARSNPPRAVWKAWADHCWHSLEHANG